MSPSKPSKFVPALIVVDFQEDFCPPNGSLPIPDGRAIAPTVNHLLTLPFTLKVATRDWHPRNHISFHTNHTTNPDGTTTYTPLSADPSSQPPPYTTTITIAHPSDASKSYTSLLWPEHCIADTKGSQLIPELDQINITNIVDKGQDPTMEMYSAFWDPLHINDSGITALLKKHDVTDVFVVGLAADYCVAETVKSAAEEGFKGWVVEEGTRAVSTEGWEGWKKSLAEKGVDVVNADGAEVGWVKELK